MSKYLRIQHDVIGHKASSYLRLRDDTGLRIKLDLSRSEMVVMSPGGGTKAFLGVRGFEMVEREAEAASEGGAS